MSGATQQVADRTDRLTHLLVIGRVDAEEFHRQGGGGGRRRTVNRAAHGRRLGDQAAAAFSADDQARVDFDEAYLRATGSIIVVEGADAVHPLKLEALDHVARREWILLSVQITEGGVEQAVVWVSDSYRARFLSLFDDYLNVDTKTGKPKNEALVVNIGRIRASLLRDLWQSDGEPPQTGAHWWEIWLQSSANSEVLLRRFGEVNGLQVAQQRMILDQRIIMWIRARWDDLTIMPLTAVPIAEIRRAQFIDTVDDLDSDDQAELVTDLADRLKVASSGSPAVCLLDTGVRRSHAILAGSLDNADWLSVTTDGPGDVKGHGTYMAGLALLGPLDPQMLSSGPIQLLHRLESVKLLPDRGPDHDRRTYGFITAQAVSAPVVAARRRRVLCMPITAPKELSTEPSLWSASVDALAVGTDVGHATEDGIELLGPPDATSARLFVVSVGNVGLQVPPPPYLDLCDASVVQDPAQAWNVLVVGASTELTATPSDPTFTGWTTMAAAGDLSPHSRTGVLIPPNWPIRPDICMEGGNVLTNGQDLHENHPVLGLATTGHRDDLALATANASSAATAQASRIAARAMATYPDYWPETIRGLVVHGAEWTPAMRSVVDSATSVAAKRAALGRYGWGIPDESAVLTSGRRAVTMVVQDQFVPFTGESYAMRQFRLHRLPWPTDVLLDLGPGDVRLKVTLSYFIEPSAPRRGWRNRYAYASHGLRFELKNTTETVSEFVRRVNRDAGDEEDGGRTSTSSGADRWRMGPKTRNGGSLHQDIWLGSGAELAQCGVLAVHPVGGWWKNGRRKDRKDRSVRYALIVSLTTDAEGVDIYEPIATQLEVDINAVAIEV